MERVRHAGPAWGDTWPAFPTSPLDWQIWLISQVDALEMTEAGWMLVSDLDDLELSQGPHIGEMSFSINHHGEVAAWVDH